MRKHGGGGAPPVKRAVLAHKNKFKEKEGQTTITVFGQMDEALPKGQSFVIESKTYFLTEDATIPAEGQIDVPATTHKP